MIEIGTESVNGFYLEEYMQPDPEMMKTYCKCVSLALEKSLAQCFACRACKPGCIIKAVYSI